jgi:LacI family transcriptional regulator
MTSDENINITQLAKKLNLSVTTVSRVLNGKAEVFRIKPETAQRVRDAAIKMNYVPNNFARCLKLAKSETIGIIVPDISNPFFADLIKVTENHCRANGYAVFIADSDNDIEQENEMLLIFKKRKVDGIIIAPVGTDFKHISKFKKAGFPLVLVDRWDPSVNLPVVTSDNFEASFLATEYLISNGHTSIACIQGIPKSLINNDRVEGFKKAIQSYGLEDGFCPIVGDDFSIKNGYDQTIALFNKPQQPTAILALNNSILLGVLKAAFELGIHIPEQVSLISFDEQVYSAYLNTPITTIEQNIATIGKKSVELIMDQIKDPFKINNTILKIPTKINFRLSVKKLL